MNNSNLVRFGKSIRNLRRNSNRLAERDWAGNEHLSYGLSIHQFHGDVTRSAHVSELVNRNDIGMAERAGRTGLLLESRQSFGLRTALQGKSLDGDFAFQAGISGAVHLAHATGPQPLENFVTPETRARRQRGWVGFGMIRKAHGLADAAHDR